MKTFLVAWSGDVPGAQFVRALGAADACLRLDFEPTFLVPSGAGTWSGHDEWTKEGLAVVEVLIDTELGLDLTETIAVLVAGRGRMVR